MEGELLSFDPLQQPIQQLTIKKDPDQPLLQADSEREVDLTSAKLEIVNPESDLPKTLVG